MVAASIFILILVTVFMLHRPKPKMALIFFGVSMTCITLLFLHHAIDDLGISF